ncbi:LarC family nickel insertion protein [Tengunoibacter tsumagoiensis]|uniref:UPF0272 protein n=1 Tax=Tengunoibacter tsumagoiensis TaxID=2014871 RepID=A0A401ZZN1_9CHLR|nr:LarC family nickel insertion protein [Tengunoibacter tsumagoiensis]GCE12304.1 UPF0272 protein [Tengunoibacter tsumagoiensis]
MQRVQREAYLDCQAGVSGQSLLAALLDAGCPVESIRSALSQMQLELKTVTASPDHRYGSAGTRLHLLVAGQSRSISELAALLAASHLPSAVQLAANTTFQHLLVAKQQQGSSELLFSPLMIAEVVGVVTGLHELGISRCSVSSLPLTTGLRQTPIGLILATQAWTLEIARQAGLPWRPTESEGELVTPIGAALLATVAQFQSPAPTFLFERIGSGFAEEASGYVRLCLGEQIEHGGSDSGSEDTDWITLLETHIDNMSGELLGGLMERLLGQGALDVSYTPIQMKKNRPATRLTVICALPDGERLASLLLRETTTLGVRLQSMQRLKAQRQQEQIETPLGPMLIKVKLLGQTMVSASPEYEECQRLALAHHLPLLDVYEIARQAIASTFIERKRR